MGVISSLYADYKRLQEELYDSQGTKKWDEKTRRYYSVLKRLFPHRK